MRIKRTLALILALVMVLGMMPTTFAFAEETTEPVYATSEYKSNLPLPKIVVDNLASSGIGTKNVYDFPLFDGDYNAFTNNVYGTWIDDPTSETGKAYKYDPWKTGTYDRKYAIKTYGAMHFYTTKPSYKIIASIYKASLVANENAGYQWYRIANVSIPEEGIGSYMSGFQWYFQYQGANDALNGDLKGKKVDMYVRLRIDGSIESEAQGEAATITFDRFIFVKPCEAHHTTEDWKEIAPATCGTGSVDQTVCPNCEGVKTRTNNNATGEHSYGEYTVTTPATCTGDAIETATCTTCGAEDSRAVAGTATGHNMTYKWDKAANQYVATCANDCGTTSSRNTDAALPQDVLTALAEEGIGLEHVYDYTEADFVVDGVYFLRIDDAAGATARAIECKSSVKSNANYIGIITDIVVSTSKGYTLGTITLDQQKANEGKGYVLYKLENITLPTDASGDVGYLSMFRNTVVQNKGIWGTLNSLQGHTADLYISMRIDGKFNWQQPYPCYGIDRMILVDKSSHSDDCTCVAAAASAAAYTYAAGEGTGTMDGAVVTEHTYITLPECAFTAPAGYEFAGWKIGNAIAQPGETALISEDTEIVATYTESHVCEYTEEVTKQPTCTEKGVKTFTCTCGASYTEEIDATGHTEAEAVVENKVEADCDTEGSYDTVVYCSVCGEELSRETTTVDALGHSYNAVVTAPTYNAQGYTTYTCSVCGDSYVADYVDALIAVAEADGVKYGSLAEAIANGTSVKLLKDASGEGVVIDKDVTIDFGGFTYTFTSGVGSYDSCGFQILKDNTVVLENGTLNVAEESKATMYMLVQNYADLTVNNMVLDGTNLDKWSTTDQDSYVLSNNSGNVVINGETDIIANDEGTLAYAFDVCKYNSYAAPTVTVNTTGTINGNVEVTGGDLNVEAATINGALVYTSGTATKAETVTLAAPEGYEWVNGVLTAVNYVAQVGTEKFETLDEALAAVTAGSTLELLADATITAPIKATADLTINGNGNTLTYTGTDRAITVESGADADLTVKDLTVVAEKAQRGINYNTNGALVLDKVTVSGATYAVNLPSSSDGAVVTITNSSLSGNIALNVWGENAVINVTDTALVGVDKTDVEGYSTVKLNNNGTDAAEGTVITITGGSISAEDDSYAYSNSTATGVINVSETTVVTGPVGSAVAVINYGNTSYSFATLAEAIEKAQNGETVTLLKDVSVSEIIVLDKAITLNGNGKTLTSTAGRAINVSGADGVTIKNLTINASGERAINVIQNATNVTVKNVVATAANYTVNVASSAANAVVTVENSDLTGLNVINVGAAGAQITVTGGKITCNDQTDVENYSALTLNKDATGASIVANNVEFEIKGDSSKAVNGATNGTITIDGSTNEVVEDVAYISYGNNYYGFSTLAEAVAKAQDGETVVLMKNASGAGVVIDKDVTIDFGGYTYTFTSGVGSGNLTSNGFQILKDNTVVLKNGTLKVADEDKAEFYTLIQNYANLTVTDMVLDGTNLDKWSTSDQDSYVLSNNSGNVVINGKTDIIANDEGELAYAFDAFSKAGYEAPTVTVNTTGTITGNVEVTGGDLNVEAATINGALVYTSGTATKAETVTLAAPEGYEWVNGVLTAVNYVAQVGEKKYETLAEALAAEKEAGTTDLVITIIGTNDKTSADSFDLPYGTAFDSVTIKQDNGGEPYYMATLYTGSRTNGGTFVFDGVNIIVTEQYMFEGNVKLANNSVVKSVAEANCFHYYSTTTVEPGSKLLGVIDEMRGGELIIDGGRTDGEYNSTPDAQDAIMSISWNGDSVTVKNGAYVKINAANEVGRLTVKSGASLNVYDSKLESYQWIANEGTINADIDSQITTQKITGAGTITVDATGFDGTAVKVIDADMSEFTGEIEIANASAGFEIKEDGIYVVKIPAIKVTYPNGTVEYYEDILEAVPYTTNCPRLEGAVVTLQKDISGQGLRLMENDMVLDLNGYTYTITAGTGSQNTNTSGFQIRPEVTTKATIKNGTIKVAEGAPVVWMFNSYATDFVVEDVVVDCANMAYSYGESVFVHVSRPGDNTNFTGTTKLVNFDAAKAGSIINVGGTMTIEETVEFDGTVELDAGATLTAPAGLTVVAAEGYEVVYENGIYTTVEAKDYVAETNGVKYESLAEAIANGTSVTLLANTDEAVEVSKVVTINRNGYTAGNLIGVNGYVVLNSLSDQYVIGEEPTATANNLGEKIIPEGEWNQYTGSLTPGVGDLPLSFVMQFKADQDEADMATSPYADWYGDFVLTFTGIEEGSFTADDCYLAGFYGDFGWIKIPVDGMEIENGTRYPVMLGVGMGQKYDYICTGVKDFLCALYIPDEILAANPNLEVNLELAVVDNSQGSDAARDALIANENVYEVADHTYTAADFKTSVAKIGETFYATLAKAVEAAEAGAVIELLANTDEVVTVNMALTINKNGYTAANVTAGADVLMAVYEDKYAFGTLPNAEIELLNDILVDVDSHYIYDLVGNQSLTTSTDPFNLQVAMKFTAKDTLEQAQANAFSGYTTDFFIKIDGLTQESFVGDGCYLAGYYPWDDKSVDDGLWVVIPLDGFTVENGVVYPMISAAGFDFKYTDIVSSVGQFICGIYLTPEVMEANPNLTVQLDLGLSENQTEAQKSNYIEVDTSIYDVEDINVPYVAQVTTAKFKALSEAVAYGDAVELLADTDEAVVLNVNTVINRNGFTASALSAAAGYEVVETADTYTVAEVVIPDAMYGFSDSMQAFLSLESIVEMNVGFKMTKDDVELTPEEAAPFMDKVGLLVWKGAAVSGEATIENSEIVLTNVTYNTEKNRFEVKTDGIPAKEMGDALCFRPYYVDENGDYIYGRLIEDYSPKKYSYIQIAAGGADTAVNIALLNYGAAAQVHFNYNVDNLMNSDLSDEQKAMDWDGTLVRSDWAIPEGKEGNLTRAAEISTRGAYLSLEGTIDVNFYSMADAEIVKAEMLLWNEADYNAADVLSEENASQIANMSKNESKNRYEYKYEGIAAKEMFFPIYGCAKFTDVNGNVYYSGVVAYCAERAAYVGQNDVDANLADLYKRIAIYGDAARTYFGNR